MRGHAVDERDVFDHVRRQRRLAMQVVLPFLAALTVALICFAVFPAVGRWHIGSVPMAWIVLGPVALFSILALGIWSERRALRLENDWVAARRQIVSRGAE